MKHRTTSATGPATWSHGSPRHRDALPPIQEATKRHERFDIPEVELPAGVLEELARELAGGSVVGRTLAEHAVATYRTILKYQAMVENLLASANPYAKLRQLQQVESVRESACRSFLRIIEALRHLRAPDGPVTVQVEAVHARKHAVGGARARAGGACRS